jgi:pyrrolidone-carboxylate peptidase
MSRFSKNKTVNRILFVAAFAILMILFHAGHCLADLTNNILLTGYWPPTGGIDSMLKPFNQDPVLNPGGWVGGNWEGLGYDVYAYFPTFPGGTGSNPKGNGDFEVDYQDTWNDFWQITDELHPVAIMSYGNGAGKWEIEYNARNLGYWYNDYVYPRQPTPSPPDGTGAQGVVRHSTLPVEDIASAINAANLSTIGSSGAWVDWEGNPGGFLCEYMAYLTMWYQDIHSAEDDPFQVLAAGFTHVAGSVSIGDATLASQIALRETIDFLDSVTPVPIPGAVWLLGSGLIGLAGIRKGLRA